MSDSMKTDDKEAGGDKSLDSGSDWRASLPEDLRAEPSLATFKDVGSLAKSFVHAQRMRNDKGLILPADDALPEEWDGFYKALGRPETPDKYEFSEVKLPEGQTVDADMEKDFREQAYKTGLTAKQAAALRDWYFGTASKKLESFEAQVKEGREQAENVLRKDWGGKFDENLARAKAALQEFIPQEDLKETIEALDAGPGNDPRLIKVFFNISQAMTEDKIVGKAAQFTTKTALEKALEITRDPAYIEAHHPQHKQKMKEAEELFKLAYPESKG